MRGPIMEQKIIDPLHLEKINRVIVNAANQANLLAINTAIIAEKLDSKEGINVIAKELQTLAEQLNLAAEELANITDEHHTV